MHEAARTHPGQGTEIQWNEVSHNRTEAAATFHKRGKARLNLVGAGMESPNVVARD